MKKHPFNIYPEAKPEDYAEILEDIRSNGFDRKFPIIIYEGAILDGWNRQRSCDELGLKPIYSEFRGTESEAIELMARSNKRRNLNSGQKATVAAEADEIIAKIRAKVEKDRRQRQAENQKLSDKKLSDSPPSPEPKSEHADKSATKAAALFGTNRTYVNQATKIKKEAPEIFEKVKSGTMTMQDANKAVRAIPKDPWTDDEKKRKAKIEAGISVVANREQDKNLIKWAESKGVAIYIGRGSIYGNPFVLGKDGSRDDVCDHYEPHYLPFKPSIHKAKSELVGKVLVCHCYPERCHGDCLV